MWEAGIILGLLVILSPVLWFLYKKTSTSSTGLVGGGTPVLSKYSRDLTKMAREKQLDPVIGRKAEIARVIQILSRRTKNNPVLIGKAGIGKTAIAEGLALAIADKNVPQVLYGKRVLSLDLTGILAGTKYRGEFEQRLKKIMVEITNAKRNIILFIDEIHALAEAGEAEGAIKAADILKPLLARGELQVVGATTSEEYDKYIKQDRTLDRRLQPIYVSEPSAGQTREILDGIKAIYEDYHKVSVQPSALDAAIKLTKNIKNRALPDKAIDALDEACSKVRIKYIGKTNHNQARPKVTSKEVAQVIKEWQANKYD